MSGTKIADSDRLASLEAIEVGGATVAQARVLLQGILKGTPSEDIASEVFSALRSWTGRMLRASISGDDLRAWHSLFKAVAAQFRGDLRDYAVRTEVLADFIYERVGMAESRPIEDVLSRRHVRVVLVAIAASAAGRIERADLGPVVGLEQANLTRVCTMMVDAGLIARFEGGRSVSFELTATGAMHVRSNSAGTSQPAPWATEDALPWQGISADEMAEVSSSAIAATDLSQYDAPYVDAWVRKEVA